MVVKLDGFPLALLAKSPATGASRHALFSGSNQVKDTTLLSALQSLMEMLQLCRTYPAAQAWVYVEGAP